MSKLRHWLILIVLSLSGGIIFLLPFLFEVYYRSVADALGVSNTEMGVLFSAFGITSLIVYFPGGWLADRMSPRKLMTLSLIATGLGGFWFATFPAYEIVVGIHIFWGVTIDRRVTRIEATQEAEQAWSEQVAMISEMSLFGKANSWYMGANIPGKTRVFTPYVGGMLQYRERRHEIAENGYVGFSLQN